MQLVANDFKIGPGASLRTPTLFSACKVEGNPSTLRRQAMVDLQIINPLEQTGWDSLVSAHPQATFVHRQTWARVLQETYGHTPLFICKMEQGRLVALLPLVEVSSTFTGRRGVSLPFIDFCKPLGEDL